MLPRCGQARGTSYRMVRDTEVTHLFRFKEVIAAVPNLFALDLFCVMGTLELGGL